MDNWTLNFPRRLALIGTFSVVPHRTKVIHKWKGFIWNILKVPTSKEWETQFLPKALAQNIPLSPMGISSRPPPVRGPLPPPLRSAFAAITPVYLPPHLFFLILSPTIRRGRKLNSSGCLHLVPPSAAQTRSGIWRWETRRGQPRRAQLTPSLSESSERAAGLAKSRRPSRTRLSLQIFAALAKAASQTFECFPTWLCGSRPPSRGGRKCLCVQTFRVPKKRAGTRLSKPGRQGKGTMCGHQVQKTQLNPALAREERPHRRLTEQQAASIQSAGARGASRSPRDS